MDRQEAGWCKYYSRILHYGFSSGSEPTTDGESSALLLMYIVHDRKDCDVVL